MLHFLRSHLQAKLTIAFVVVVLIPTIIVTAFSLSGSTEAVIEATGDHEINTAKVSATQLQDALKTMKGDLLFLRNDPGVKDYAEALTGADDPAALTDVYDLFSNILVNSAESYKDIRILDANGQEVVRVDIGQGEPAIITGDELENKANRPYFFEAAKLPDEGVYFSGLDLNVTQGKIDDPPLPVIRYSTPIYTTEGQLVGVLVLKAFAEPLLEPLVPDDEGEDTYLIDSKGNYWLNPDSSKLYGEILGTGVTLENDVPGDAAVMLANDEGVLNGSSDRPNVFQSFVRIPLEDQPDSYWTLVFSRPIDKVLAEINQSRAGVLAIAALAFIAAVVVAGGIAQSIVNPVRRLTAAAAEISQDKWDSPLPDAPGQDEIGTLANSFKAMVDAVQTRNAALNDLNQSLTAQAKELTRANAIARESARLKSEFMSTMSHELRTPLNAILGFSGIMLQGMGGELDEDAVHMVERIDSNSQRLLGLINDVLDIAKIEAGRMELTAQPFSPRALAERWRTQTSVLAEKKRLQLDIQVDPNLPDIIIGDAERITQIGINLLSNAFKFTEEGSVTLNMMPLGAEWIIRVTDTGVGIPPHALNYIFDEFRQVDGTSTRSYGGSGLGLSIVRNLCRMMGGSVRASSELGKGSTFTVTLPLNMVDQAVQESSLEMV